LNTILWATPPVHEVVAVGTSMATVGAAFGFWVTHVPQFRTTSWSQNLKVPGMLGSKANVVFPVVVGET
jgi:hypothetical protein